MSKSAEGLLNPGGNFIMQERPGIKAQTEVTS